MGELKIKAEHAKKKIVFGSSDRKVPLGEKSQEDLKKLAIIAQSSKDRSLINLFEGELPSLQELQHDQVKKAVADIPKANAAATAEVKK